MSFANLSASSQLSTWGAMARTSSGVSARASHSSTAFLSPTCSMSSVTTLLDSSALSRRPAVPPESSVTYASLLAHAAGPVVVDARWNMSAASSTVTHLSIETNRSEKVSESRGRAI